MTENYTNRVITSPVPTDEVARTRVAEIREAIAYAYASDRLSSNSDRPTIDIR